MTQAPLFYIPHGGGPCFFMDWTPPDTWSALAGWMRALPQTLKAPPKALLFISAHWEEPEFTLAANPAPSLFYDYSHFPPHTYELTWPAPAATDLFARVQELAAGAGIPLVLDTERDFDHGVFIPGLLFYPQANVPVLQVSLRRGLNPDAHIALGKALAPLREDGVLFVGSGMSYHNMRAFRYNDNTPIPGADVFDTWLTQTVCECSPEAREERLSQWATAPGARAAHPREEHLIPLMVLAGAAGKESGHLEFSCRAMGAPLSAYRFG